MFPYKYMAFIIELQKQKEFKCSNQAFRNKNKRRKQYERNEKQQKKSEERQGQR